MGLIAVGFGIYRFFSYGLSSGNILHNGVLLFLVGTVILATAVWHYRQIRR